MNKTIRLLTSLMILPASLLAATIGGTVTTGATGGAAGTPVAEAKVVLIATGGGGGGGGGTRLDSTVTDTTGKYTFTLDTTGFRQIQVTATGFNTGTGTVNAASDTGNYTVNVNLISSAPGKLEGKVSSDSVAGTPIVGAQVIVRRNTGGTFTPESTLTDNEGKYVFDSIPGNTGYTVAVSAAGFTSITRNNVSIAGGQTSTQNFLMVPPPAPGAVSGKVVKASDSSALAGARVILSRSGGGGGGGFAPDTMLTDAQGAFAVDSIPANTGYTLTVSLAGYVTASRNNITVTSGQTTTQTIALAPPPPPGSIAGKVVKASDSSALAGARVILSRFGGGGSFTPDTVLTDAQGGFALDSVPANTGYTLTVSLAGYETMARNAVTVVTGQAATQNFALAPPIGPGSIAGKITKASDAGAVSGARVILSRSGGGGGGFSPDTVLANASGEYAFDSVANQNNYVLTVSAAGFSTTVSNNISVAGGLKTTADFALDALAEGDTTGTVKGIVRNGADDAPVPGARVILSRVTGGGGGGGTAIDTVTADAGGAFAFPDLVAGNYRVNVSATGFQASQSGTLALAAGGTFMANIEVTTASSIMASGRGAAPGRPYWNAGRLVVELDASKRAKSLAVFGTDGKLRHRLKVAPGSSRVTLPADVTPGSRALLRVEY